MTEKMDYGIMEKCRCLRCEHDPPAPDKDPCEFCLAQYPQGNPTGFHDNFKAKEIQKIVVTVIKYIGPIDYPRLKTLLQQFENKSFEIREL